MLNTRRYHSLLISVAALAFSGVALAGKPGGGDTGGGTSTVAEPVAFSASNIGPTSIGLTWESAGATAVGYTLAYQAGSSPAATCTSGTQVDVGTALAHTISGLNPGDKLYIRLCTRTATGTRSNGATTTVVATAFPVPTAQAWFASGNGWIVSDQFHMTFDPVTNRTYVVGVGKTATDRVWFVEARRASDGSLDPAFAGGRLAIDTDNGTYTSTGASQTAQAVETGSDGSVYVCGNGCINGSCGGRTQSTTIGFVLMKLSSTGQKLWTASALSNTSNVQERCLSAMIRTEGADEYVYTFGDNGSSGTGSQRSGIAKFNAATGAKVWETYTGNGTGHDMIKHAALGSDGIYVVNRGGLGGTTTIAKYSFNGTLIRQVSTPWSNIFVSIAVGKVGDTEYVWIAPYGQQNILRYSANLDLAPASETGVGCHNLNLSPGGTGGIAIGHLAITNELGDDRLYAAVRRWTGDINTTSDGGIMRFDMTGGTCVSRNGAGDVFDSASRLINAGDPMTFDAPSAGFDLSPGFDAIYVSHKGTIDSAGILHVLKYTND